MTRRNLVHIAREPMQLSDVTVQPVLFTVLFVYVFGSGMVLPGHGSYTNFVIAGLLSMNLVTSSMGTGIGLATDISTGMIERFRTLPMWRASVLVGRTVSDLLSAAVCSVIVAVTGPVCGMAPRNRDAVGAGRLRGSALFRLCPDLADCLRGHHCEGARVGDVRRFHHHLSVGIHFQCLGTDAPHAELVAANSRLEPGELSHFCGP